MAKRKGDNNNNNDDGGSGKKAKKVLIDEGNSVSIIAINLGLMCTSSTIPLLCLMSTCCTMSRRHNTHIISYHFIDYIFYILLINMLAYI